jgi:hypothetical protein
MRTLCMASTLLLGLFPLLSFAACSEGSHSSASAPNANNPIATDSTALPTDSVTPEPVATDSTAPEEAPGNSQTGSIGASYTPECQVDADCVDTSVYGPAAVSDVELVGAQCMHLSVTTELPVCECSVRYAVPDAGAADAPVAKLYPGNRPEGCSEQTRSGNCLYCENEFPGCDTRDTHSCDAVCADVTERVRRDARKAYQVRTRLARCVAEYTKVCHVITEIDGQCYVGRFGAWLPAPVDCSLSDDELAAHFKDPSTDPCGPRPSVSCTQSEDCPRGLACTDGTCQSCERRCTVTSAGSTCEGGGACAPDEACARGTCVPAANAACGSQGDRANDCPENQSCYVTGISSTGRGNENSHSSCIATDPSSNVPGLEN